MNRRMAELLTVVAIGALTFLSPAVVLAQSPAGAAERFKALYTREWNWRQAQYSGLDEDADRTAAVRDRFPMVDAATQGGRLRYWTNTLKELSAVPAAELSPEDQLNYAIYRAQVEALEASARFRDYEKPFNSDSSFWAEVTGAAQRPLRNLGDYRAYLRLLADVPRYFSEQTVNMKAGLARGFSVPRVTLAGRDASIANVADARASRRRTPSSPPSRRCRPSSRTPRRPN